MPQVFIRGKKCLWFAATRHHPRFSSISVVSKASLNFVVANMFQKVSERILAKIGFSFLFMVLQSQNNNRALLSPFTGCSLMLVTANIANEHGEALGYKAMLKLPFRLLWIASFPSKTTKLYRRARASTIVGVHKNRILCPENDRGIFLKLAH